MVLVEPWSQGLISLYGEGSGVLNVADQLAERASMMATERLP
jgi:hypothetical protein